MCMNLETDLQNIWDKNWQNCEEKDVTSFTVENSKNPLLIIDISSTYIICKDIADLNSTIKLI